MQSRHCLLELTSQKYQKPTIELFVSRITERVRTHSFLDTLAQFISDISWWHFASISRAATETSDATTDILSAAVYNWGFDAFARTVGDIGIYFHLTDQAWTTFEASNATAHVLTAFLLASNTGKDHG